MEDFSAVEGGDVFRVPLANVNVAAANLTETETKVAMAQKLVQSGFEPSAVLDAMGLPQITHTGVPSTQLQPLNTLDPADPSSAYKV